MEKSTVPVTGRPKTDWNASTALAVARAVDPICGNPGNRRIDGGDRIQLLLYLADLVSAAAYNEILPRPGGGIPEMASAVLIYRSLP